LAEAPGLHPSPINFLETSVIRTAFLVAFALPFVGSAQTGSVSGSLGVDVVWTGIAGHQTLLLGGHASLRVGPRISVGGFGYGMPASIRLVEGAVPEDLRLGYGGLMLGLDLVSTKSLGLRGSLLFGAANAQIRAQPIGNQLGSDNFLVAEPRLSLYAPQGSRLSGALEAGYRFVAGVEDLPRLDTHDLRGWTLALSLSVGGLR
jgi:hypothetical protein